MSRLLQSFWFAAVAAGFLFSPCREDAMAADAPSAKLALSFRPIQKDVDYDIPDEKEIEKCKVEVERVGKSSGWVVLNPNGAVLRRFVDTNGDNVVDQWRYYKTGLEVYRDIDSNFNNKVDQYRWLNSGGTRWGIDTNEDTKIDVWRVISAEEASREAVRALVNRDEQALAILLVTAEDLKTLGVDTELSEKITEAVSGVGKKMQAALTAAKSIDSKSKWMRFDVSQPSVIPADDGKAKIDLILYENAMAIVDNGGKTSILQIGEVLRIGETWKLTQIPVALEGNQIQIASGVLMQPPTLTGGNAGPSGGTVTPELQKLLEKLQDLDKRAPTTSDSAKAIGRYNEERADLLAEIVKLAEGDDRTQWTKQMVDGIAAAVQTGNFTAGVGRLKAIEAEVRKGTNKNLSAYVAYRRMLAEYTLELQSAKESQRQEVQDQWLKDLETFAKDSPDAEDAPEAMLQLAIALEFSGKVADSRKWYDVLSSKYGKSQQGQRASGAAKRLDLKGKPFQLSGAGLKGGKIDSRDLRGKVVLVLYWASWCKPCTEDLPQLRALYQLHKDQGFEILGVNLDSTAAAATSYIADNRIAWPQLYEAGGLESPLATAYGIISLPTMILVDSDGLVHTRSVSTNDLKALVPELVKKK